VKKIRIIIADDHIVLREGMRNLLEREKDLEVVGEASDGQECVKLVSELKPDVVLMDIVMPQLNGVEATRQIKRLHSTTNVLILTAYSDIRYILGLLEAGACGYLLKSAHSSELIGAIRSVHSGDSVLDPMVTQKLLQRVAGLTPGIYKAKTQEQLSYRQTEVLKLAAKGMSNKDIADVLSLSVRTVKAHFTSIFNKMGVNCRIGAVIKGLREGYVRLEDIAPEME